MRKTPRYGKRSVRNGKTADCDEKHRGCRVEKLESIIHVVRGYDSIANMTSNNSQQLE